MDWLPSSASPGSWTRRGPQVPYRGPVVDLRGHITGSITSMFDVTEQKATEAELLRLATAVYQQLNP